MATKAIDPDRVWIEDRDWRVPSLYPRCRQRAEPDDVSVPDRPFYDRRIHRCPRPAAADLARRGHWRARSLAEAGPMVSWWAYCERHLYGRRIRDGRVEVSVPADSPAARRGYTGGKEG